MLFSFFFFFSVFFYLVLVYPRKILVLLLMECVFLFSLFSFFYLGVLSSNVAFFILLIFTLFLVLDSVVGVTILISVSRSHGPHSHWFLYWLAFLFFLFFLHHFF